MTTRIPDGIRTAATRTRGGGGGLSSSSSSPTAPQPAPEPGALSKEAASDVARDICRKMTIEEATNLVALPYAMVMAHRALRVLGKTVDDATRVDVERLCESLVAWAKEEGRKSSISDVTNELESRLQDLESTLAAGWRGMPIGRESPRADDRDYNAFGSVAAIRARKLERQVLASDWPSLVLDKMTAEENWNSVIKPRLLMRAYDVLSERKNVDDEEVKLTVNSRLRKWLDLWRQHETSVFNETGSKPDTEGFRAFLKPFLSMRLAQFANSINESAFRTIVTHDTEREKIFHEEQAKEPSKDEQSFRNAVESIRRAKTSADVCALLTSKWVREALVDAPKFSLSSSKSDRNFDHGGQMMKDWQRESGFLLRQLPAGKKAPAEDDPESYVEWQETELPTGPFRVHFMRACGELENAMLAYDAFNTHNITEDERREARAKGAARVMFVASRTLRSGDALNFIHELFGPPPRFSVTLVEPEKTKDIIRNHSLIDVPIVIDVSSHGVEVRCVDVFLISKQFLAANDEEEIEDFEPWCCVALSVRQSLRVADDGSLKLIKQRISFDRIPQPVLDAFMRDIVGSSGGVTPLGAARAVNVTNDVFAK